MRMLVVMLSLVGLVAAPSFGSAVVAAEPLGRVDVAARMGVARAAHSATLLPDGQVLVAGGCTVDGCEMDENGATAERYDPQLNRFTAAGPMTSERVGHTATRLPDGRVWLAGGWDSTHVLSSTDIYDPASDTFTPGPSLASPRGGFTATSLADGRVLVAGGTDGTRRLAAAELYDPLTGTLAVTGSMGTPRSEHIATLLNDGRVLVAGGSRDDDDVLASAEVYDPATGRFSPAGAMGAMRRKHAAAALPDGRILIAGGSNQRDSRGQYASAELFDPIAGTFSPAASMRATRFKFPDALAVLPGGDILIAGGDDRAEVYRLTAERFETVEGYLGGDLAFATATRLADGRVLIVGGYDPTISPTATTWLYRSDA